MQTRQIMQKMQRAWSYWKKYQDWFVDSVRLLYVKFMFEKKKPTLVETPLAPEPVKETVVQAAEKQLTETMKYVNSPQPLSGMALVESEADKFIAAVKETVTMADLMMELSIIGEVFAKRKLFAVVSLRHQNGHFNLTCSWKDDAGEQRAFVGRKISDSLTPKGLALVVGELKLAVGI